MSTRGKTLLTISAVCAVFWVLTLFFPLEVGAAAAGTGVICFVAWLIIKVRQAFAFAEHDLADFVRGKDKKESLQVERLKAVRAAIAEAKARKEAASIGLKQPNQSSTVRHINERLSALICEQLQLEGALGKKVA